MTFKTALLMTAIMFLFVTVTTAALAQNPPGEAVNLDEPTLARDDKRLKGDSQKMTAESIVPAVDCDTCLKDAVGQLGPDGQPLILPNGQPVVPATKDQPVKK